MAYNYLSLVNDVLQKVNEVPLNSSNFATATGFYADAKTSINLSLNDIVLVEWEWPFNHVTHETTLVVDQVRYDFPTDAKSVSFDTFRIRGDDTLANNTTSLVQVDYEEYLQKYSDMEYRPTDHHSLPTNVFKARNLEFGIIAPPDKAYLLDYEYYTFPEDLEDWDDVPTVPFQFRNTILSGAMKYAYLFRGELEPAGLSEQLFTKQLSKMKAIFVNRSEYVRSTMLNRR